MSRQYCSTRAGQLQTAVLRSGFEELPKAGAKTLRPLTFVHIAAAEQVRPRTYVISYTYTMAAIALLRAVLPLLLLSGCGLQPVLSMAQATPPAQAAQDAETPSSAEEPLAEARRQLRLNAFVEAEATVRHALVTAPNSADAQFLLGYILFREIPVACCRCRGTGRSRQAEGLYRSTQQECAVHLSRSTRRVHAFNVPSAFDLKIVALDYILLGDYPDADKWMTKALDGDPSDEQGWYLRRAHPVQTRRVRPALSRRLATHFALIRTIAKRRTTWDWPMRVLGRQKKRLQPIRKQLS